RQVASRTLPALLHSNAGTSLKCAVDWQEVKFVAHGERPLRQATETLQGDFLEGLNLPDCREFQSWCIGEREETRRLRVRLLAALVARLEGEPDHALPHARALRGSARKTPNVLATSRALNFPSVMCRRA